MITSHIEESKTIVTESKISDPYLIGVDAVQYLESFKVVQCDLAIAVTTDQNGAVSTTLHYCSVCIDTGASPLGPGIERHDFSVVVRCGYELDFCFRVEDESKTERSRI